MKSLENLKQDMVAAIDQARGIQAAADQANRELSPDEAVSLEGLLNKADQLKDEVARRERLENAANFASQPNRAVRPEGVTAPVVSANSGGFRSADEFYKALGNKARGQFDARLSNVTTYQSEGVNGDGGYALPPDFRAGIVTLLKSNISLLERLSPIFVKSNAATIPLDTDAPWSGAGVSFGVVAEGGTIAETKTPVTKLDVTLTKYGAIIPVTEELIEDGTGMADFVQRKAADKLAWKINALIFDAFKTSPSKLALPKNGEAVGAAPSLTSVQKMWVACPSFFRGNAVWLANPALEIALQNFTVGNQPVYMPAGGISGNPLPTLYGRPIIYTELAAAVGTEGDLMLVDPSSFYAVQKAEGVRVDASREYGFAQDMIAYRFLTRMSVKSQVPGIIIRPDTTSCSNVITLATR